jgi:sugar phosphate isomerase/epimerase
VALQLSTRESGIPRPPAGEVYTPSYALREARRLGLGIEFSTEPADRNRQGRRTRRGLWAEDMNLAAREALRREAEELGVAITSLSSDWVWGFSEYHPTLDMWERGGEILRQDMELTADLGARVCLIHFARSRATWEQAKRYCVLAADAALRRGVVAAFEGSLWHHTGLGPLDELLRFVDELDHPALKVYAHPRGPGRAAADEIRQVGGRRLAAVHLSRADPEVDYDAFFAALRDAGYSGPLVFETEAEELPGSVEHVRPALRRQGLN